MRRHTMRVRGLSARDVVARAESTKVGSVTDLLFSPQDGEVRVVLFESGGGLGGLIREQHAALRQDLVAIGADAVIIRENASVVTKVDNLDRTGLASAAHVRGKEVYTDGGDKIGQVIDFELVPEEARLVNYIIGPTKGGRNVGIGSERAEGERIIPLQAEVVIGPNIITVPSSLLGHGPSGDMLGTQEGMNRGPGLGERGGNDTTSADPTRTGREEP